MRPFRAWLGLGAALLAALAAGCAGQDAALARLLAAVGNYPPPPANLERPRLGIPPPAVALPPEADALGLDWQAHEQLVTLAALTGRFAVLDRGRLQEILDAAPPGVVREGQLARLQPLPGLDYLLLARVSGLRVRASRRRGFFDFDEARFPREGRMTGGEPKPGEVLLDAECEVELRLVDPAAGGIAAAGQALFRRQASAAAFGVEARGLGLGAAEELELRPDERGRVLRLALDAALRDLLPRVDALLLARAAGPAAGPRCSRCGGALPGGARFCPACGAPRAAGP